MQATCEECQRDRLRCTFDPMCPDRRWLSILIEGGAPREVWPRFCYQMRGEEIKKFFKKRSIPVPLVDAKYPLLDFVRLFVKKRERETLEKDIHAFLEVFIESIKKLWEKIFTLNLSSEKIALLLGEFEHVVIFDRKKNIVTINAMRTGLNRYEELVEFAEGILKILKINHRIVSPYPGHTYFHITVKDISEKNNLEERFKEIIADDVFVKVINFNKSIHVIFGLYSRASHTLASYSINAVLRFVQLLTELIGERNE